MPLPVPSTLSDALASGPQRAPLDPRGAVASTRTRGRALLLASWALILLVLLVGCGPRGGGDASPPESSTRSGWVTILHTNDIHGAYEARPATWLDHRPMNGGFQALAAAVAKLSAEGPMILVDGGDLMAGSPLTTIEWRGVPGGGAMEFMNAVGYDAMVLGNHELDLGQEAALGLLGLAEFPVLCANLVRADTGEPFTSKARHVVERQGIRVGFFGLILDNLPEVVAAEPLRGLTVLPGAEVARSEVERLDPESDLIIALAHQGLGACRGLAREVPEIDVIMAAHDHRRTEEPIVESGVLIVETGSSLEHLGRLELQVAGDRVVDYRYQLLDLPASAIESAPAAVSDLHDELDALIEAEYGEVIGELAEPLVRDSRNESNLGNWVTDAMREAAGAQFAVTNSSGLRADVDRGPLTKRDIQEISPFPNFLCTFQATGAELRTLAQLNVKRALGLEPRGGGIVQISGLEYAYGPDGEIVELLVGGQPVGPRASYTGATSDYILLSQAERYLGFVPTEIGCTSQSIFDVLCDAAARTSPIAARVEGRIRALSAEPAREPATAGKQRSSR